MNKQTFEFGMIGLGVMGQNLLLNMADHGFKVIGYDKDSEKTGILERAALKDTVVKGVTTLQDMIDQLETPRKIMLLVPAGKPVDNVIESLLAVVEKGDIIIDGGNSHFADTLRRELFLKEKGVHFMGIGVSGGEQGARTGPSIMPGGNPEAYAHVKPILEAVAAKVNGVPCVAHLGKHGAGHFVKMVHNGIEYAIMQLISECYDLLHRGAGISNDELHNIFDSWNKGDLQSYLVEITAEIFRYDDEKTDHKLIDMILDKAGSKGTGKWTSQEAANLPTPIPTIDMAVTQRILSSLKNQRVAAGKLYDKVADPIDTSKDAFIEHVHDALYFSILTSYAQGLAMLQLASKELDMDIPMPEVVKVWRGGCIIRSSFLEVFTKVYESNPQQANILLDPHIANMLLSKLKNVRKVVASAALGGIPVGALMASLNYFESYTSPKLPTNLIQAQRDYFGAHTYERIDEPGFFHTPWLTTPL